MYDNPGWLAVDKPAGVPTIADRLGSDSVHAHLERQLGHRLLVVHRLDREVTGLLLFARDAPTHRALSMAFEDRRVRKRYEAWCEGTPVWRTAHWDDTLLRGKKRAYVHPAGKRAITDAALAGEGPCGWTRVDLWPRTGRSHQLRVHLANAGLPIVGDALYGAKAPFLASEIALRAVELVFAAGVLGSDEVHLAARGLDSRWPVSAPP
ncbi:MAG: RNA pseudouridine synthase [Deltaproteobacteria bacterium]|nr:RNA pseudouridine synthase [Deltaproteobacteria bacterium]